MTHATHLALLSIAVWVASVAVAGWLSPLANSTKIVLGLGWVGLSAAVAAAFVTYQQLTTWLAQGVSSADPNGTSAPSSASREPPVSTAQTALPGSSWPDSSPPVWALYSLCKGRNYTTITLRSSIRPIIGA